MVTVWYIGPESSIYHTRRECGALNKSMRYWHIESTGLPNELVGQAVRSKQWRERRRICKLCQKASA